MTPSRFRWALLLILVGTLLLLSNLGYISRGWWVGIGSFLPFVLIAIGVEKLFTRSRLEVVAYLSSILLVAGAIYGAHQYDAGNRVMNYLEDQEIVIADDGEARMLRAEVSISRDELLLEGTTSDLVRAWISAGRNKPKYEYEIIDGQARVRLKGGVPGDFGPFIKVDLDHEPWEMAVKDNVPLEFVGTADRSVMHLNFRNLQLLMAELEADRSDVYLTVGQNRPLIRLDLSGRDAAYDIKLPLGTGLRVIGYDDPGYFEEIGLMRTDSGFANAAYISSQSRVDLKLDEEIGSLVIESY